MKTKKEFIGLGCIAGILLILGTVADLQIAQSLYNGASGFGKLFGYIGEVPASLIASFCTMALALVQVKKNDNKLNMWAVSNMILSIFLAYMAGMLLAVPLGNSQIVFMIIMFLIVVVDYTVAKFLVEKQADELYRAAGVGLQTFIYILVVVNLLKFAWGREAYCHMAAAGTVEGFSQWFIPQGIATGSDFMAFPSGQTANAAMIMWITLIPTFVPKMQGKETLLKVIAYVWIGLVMISSLIMGTHFLSDGVIGMILSLFLFYCSCRKNKVLS